MNSHPLNGANIDGATRYATAAIPASTASMVFTVSERNIATIVGGITMVFTAAGQIAAQSQLTVPVPATTMAFSVNGDGLFSNTFLIGNLAMSFAVAGSLQRIGSMSATAQMGLDISGDPQLLGRLYGAIAMAMDTASSIISIGLMSGATGIAFAVAGDLSQNASALDADDRTFRRQYTLREFRR